MARFYLSPSDQKANVYAGNNTNEAAVCGAIAHYCKAALERNSHEVMLGHYMTMADKCLNSDLFNADAHVPIHTNAYEEQEGEAEVNGTRIFSYDLKGKGYQMAKKVFEILAPFSPGTSENIKAAPQLYEVKTPSAPTIYIEVEFHDNEKGASWLVANVKEIGEKIAEGLCNAVGSPYLPEKEKCEEGNTTGGAPPVCPQGTSKGCCSTYLKELVEVLRDIKSSMEKS